MKTPTRETWEAMKKFCDACADPSIPVSDQEFEALSYLTLIDKRGHFEPGNVRWAETATERRLNQEFYLAVLEDRMRAAQARPRYWSPFAHPCRRSE